MRGIFVGEDDSFRYDSGFVDELYVDPDSVYNNATILDKVVEMMIEGEIDVYVEHSVEKPEIAIHLIEGPPENGEQNAGEIGENAVNGAIADDGDIGDVGDLGGDDFVDVEVVQEVEKDEERVQVKEERVPVDEER
ncbi:hypothetical protein COLO4_04678 [Corchorus olitorius]|uniref:Uncharacterized protein n=1 Tax=Corchorus olitorius TaxID=93759 RepID=A0A1R3KT43_9ROSI|nr:hypothetical protein COLO4_04678 [Corchorus olitorius]